MLNNLCQVCFCLNLLCNADLNLLCNADIHDELIRFSILFQFPGNYDITTLLQKLVYTVRGTVYDIFTMYYKRCDMCL